MITQETRLLKGWEKTQFIAGPSIAYWRKRLPGKQLRPPQQGTRRVCCKRIWSTVVLRTASYSAPLWQPSRKKEAKILVVVRICVEWNIGYHLQPICLLTASPSPLPRTLVRCALSCSSSRARDGYTCTQRMNHMPYVKRWNMCPLLWNTNFSSLTIGRDMLKYLQGEEWVPPLLLSPTLPSLCPTCCHKLLLAMCTRLPVIILKAQLDCNLLHGIFL